MESTDTTKKTISTLNTLLRGELAAVETYDQVLAKITDPSTIALQENRDCHQKRTTVLSERILELGGKTDSSSGVWGSLAKLVEGGAQIFGKQAALAALQEGENRGLIDYRDANGRVDPTTQTLLDTKLLPAQKRTHQLIGTLTKAAASGKSAGQAS
jgi:hypothetical protein